MNSAIEVDAIEKVAEAVLYEGCMMSPNRASAIKNRQRFNLGVLYPEGFDASLQRTECLVCSERNAMVDIEVRYLRLDAIGHAHERALQICDLPVAELETLQFHESDDIGDIRISAESVGPDCHRLRIEIRNAQREEPGAAREKVLLNSMISVHTILSVRGGTFVSLLDPPAALAEAAKHCRNTGTFPVLAGEEGAHDAILSSPMVLCDYPRILTLTDEEKAETRQGDERARALLERRENITPEELMKLDGAPLGLPGKRTVHPRERFATDRTREGAL